jgi:hypothetical protein
MSISSLVVCCTKWQILHERNLGHSNYHLSNVSTFLKPTGKWKMWLRYRDIGEINLEHHQHRQQLQGYVISIRQVTWCKMTQRAHVKRPHSLTNTSDVTVLQVSHISKEVCKASSHGTGVP